MLLFLYLFFIGSVLPQLYCPVGQAIGPCASGQCPSGDFCDDRDQCCNNSVLKCGGSCKESPCPTGSTCLVSQNYQCCQIQICGDTIGPCASGLCPKGYFCMNGECCSGKSCVDTSPKCQEWNSRGFCNSTFYTPKDKELCAATCGLC